MSISGPGIVVSAPPFDTERRRRQPRFYPYSATPASVESVGAGIATLVTPVLTLGTTAVAVNEIKAFGELFASSTTFFYTDLAGKTFWNRPQRASVNIVMLVSVNPNANSFTGLQIGRHGTVFPWGLATEPFIQLRANLATLIWELAYAKGDAVGADQVVALSNAVVQQPIPGGAYSYRLEIDYSPANFITVRVNGVVGATVAANANFPIVTKDATVGANVFVSKGNLVADQTQSAFHNHETETLGAP